MLRIPPASVRPGEPGKISRIPPTSVRPQRESSATAKKSKTDRAFTYAQEGFSSSGRKPSKVSEASETSTLDRTRVCGEEEEEEEEDLLTVNRE